jgi:rfaE bifunctional protein nucleotidyltransferase chain/domain
VKAPLPPPASIESAVALSARVHHAGGTVVFTTGAFDLLHPGHVRHLQAARRLGDALVVGVHSDRVVRASKGLERPINPERERAEVLAALACVDAAVVFDDETADSLIRRVQPDVLVRSAGGDDPRVERELIEARGGHVVRLERVDGYSTASLVARTRARGTP